MKSPTTSENLLGLTYIVQSSDEFRKAIPENLPHFLERASQRIRRILQDMGQWTDNSAHEKLLLRLSFDLVERFLDYCPSQLPCRPLLILDGFIAEYFGKPQDLRSEKGENSILYRFLDGLLNRAVMSRDGLICLFYHLYGLKPVEIGFFLGLEEGQTQRIYKNFARWRTKGWHLAFEETGLSSTEFEILQKNMKDQSETFNQEAREHLEKLMPFFRKSEPPYYPCLERHQWHEMFRENYGLDYRTWHLPLCLPCMNIMTEVGREAFSTDINFDFNLTLFPHSVKDEEMSTLVGGNQLKTG